MALVITPEDKRMWDSFPQDQKDRLINRGDYITEVITGKNVTLDEALCYQEDPRW